MVIITLSKRDSAVQTQFSVSVPAESCNFLNVWTAIVILPADIQFEKKMQITTSPSLPPLLCSST